MSKSALLTVRASVLCALAVPFVLAAFAAATTSHDPPLVIMAPILALVVLAAIACWSRAIPHLRHRRRPDEDGDDQWPRGGDDDDPRRPDGGPDGPTVDWSAFERDFAAYVRAREGRPLLPTG